jgi:DNA excision repair protein ERCC-2
VEEIGKFKLPYTRARKGQLEITRKVFETLQHGRRLIIEAPNGSGKTAAILSAIFPAVKDLNYKVIFLVRTRKQVEQLYTEALKFKSLFPTVKISPYLSYADGCMLFNSYKNKIVEEFLPLFCRVKVKTFSCPFYHNVSQIRAFYGTLEELISWARIKRFCPMEFLRRKSLESEILINNYSTFFIQSLKSITPYILGDGKYALIIDEGHNMPAILSNLSSSLRLSDLEWMMMFSRQRSIKDLEWASFSIRRWILARRSTSPISVELFLSECGLVDRLNKLIDVFRYTLSDFYSFLNISDAARIARFISFIEYLSLFRSSDSAYIIPYRVFDEFYEIVIKELDISKIFKHITDNFNINSIILSSATFFSIGIFKEELGLEDAEVLKINTDPLNRKCLTIIDSEVSTEFNARTEELFNLIAKKIMHIYEITNGPLLVFFTSYKILNAVKNKIVYLNEKVQDKIIVERVKITFNELIDVVKDLIENDKMLLGVLGGKFSEGEDFLQGKINRVVIVGFPFPPPTAELSMYIKYKERVKGRHYAFVTNMLLPAISKTVQAAGRIFRREDQRGVVFLLDKRFSSSLANTFLPDWLKENVIISRVERLSNNDLI